jgi:hypothetical protein
MLSATSSEVALLVRLYLEEDSKFSQSAAVFKEESKVLTESLAGSVNDYNLLRLPDLVNDYYRLKAAEWGIAAERARSRTQAWPLNRQTAPSDEGVHYDSDCDDHAASQLQVSPQSSMVVARCVPAQLQVCAL